MTDIALDLTKGSTTFNDLQIVNNDLVLIDGKLGILQNVLQTIRLYLGEWFLDNTLGIDYFGQILIKNPTFATIDGILINAILNVAGVTELTSWSFTPNFIQRSLAISFAVNTTDGIVDYQGLI